MKKNEHHGKNSASDVRKKASDVYLSARAPALIKINGICIPINNQELPVEAPLACSPRSSSRKP
jgi:Tfp pilus assembly ATPase PilU